MRAMIVLALTFILTACSSNGASLVTHGCDPNYKPPRPDGYHGTVPIYRFRSYTDAKMFEEYNSKTCKAWRQQLATIKYIELTQEVLNTLDTPQETE